MLFFLIAIKSYQFVKMVVEIARVPSLKAYFVELRQALVLEFAEAQVVGETVGYVQKVKEEAEVFQAEFKREVTPIISYVTRAGTRFRRKETETHVV